MKTGAAILISGFALVWVANIYMNIYARVRLEIKKERVEIAVQEQVIAEHAETAKQF